MTLVRIDLGNRSFLIKYWDFVIADYLNLSLDSPSFDPLPAPPDHVDRQAVRHAARRWSESTCVTFKEVSSSYDGPHLRLRRHESRCESFVGVASSSGQDLHVSEDCERHVSWGEGGWSVHDTFRGT